MNNYGVYGLFIQREFPQNLSYGVRPVQVSEWSVIAVAPGQIGGKEDDGNPLFLNGWAVLWSPELMSKTDLEAHELVVMVANVHVKRFGVVVHGVVGSNPLAVNLLRIIIRLCRL